MITSEQMNMTDFWVYLDELVAGAKVVIDRPQGSRHPRMPEIVYPLDYGYLEGTTTVDGGGLDVWVGSLPHRKLVGIVCTVDFWKRDVEIKLLLGCSAEDIAKVMTHINGGPMRGILVRRDAAQ